MMEATISRQEQGSGRVIPGMAWGVKTLKALHLGQRGFTLVELLAVMAIITILAGVVAGALSGLSATGVAAQIKSDNKTIETAADRFFNDAFPQSYPVAPLETDKLTGEVIDPLVDDAGPQGVFVINFDARLPQDPTLTFTPDFIKEIPSSAALVSYRIDTNTGNVFAAADGAQLVRPSSGRVNVSVGDKTLADPGGSIVPSDSSDYTFEFKMKKFEAALEIINIEIPAGYNLGGSSVPVGTIMGKLKTVFSTDNPWQSGQVITKTNDIVAIGEAGRWKIEMNYDINESSSSLPGSVNIKNRNGVADIRIHILEMTDPTDETPGKMTLTMDRTTETGTGESGSPFVTVHTDPAHNEATETFTLVLFDHPQTASGSGGAEIIPEDTIFTNPGVAKVYRWLARAHTTIDVTGVFQVAGKQSIIIKGTAVDEGDGTGTAAAAVDDIYTVSSGQAILQVLAARGVLRNDTDPDADDTLAVVSGPTNGTVQELRSDGSFDYEVSGGIFLDDSFIYEVTDTAGETSQAKVTIDVIDGTLVSIEVEPVSPADISATGGGTQTFTATGTFSDNPAGGVALPGVDWDIAPTGAGVTINSETGEVTVQGSGATEQAYAITASDDAGAIFSTPVTLTVVN